MGNSSTTGSFEKAIRASSFLLRPRLQVTFKGKRRTEIVGIRYPVEDGFSGSASTASVIMIPATPRTTTGRALYVRALVTNFGVYSAEGVQVFIDRILRDGIVVEDERSALHWTDSEKEFQAAIKRGTKNAKYIDICSSDDVDRKLHVISQKWFKGYHRYGESGTYTLELSAEGAWPCSTGRLTLQIKHIGGRWDSLEVVSAKENNKWFRFW